MPDVVLYTRTACGYCSRALALLQRKGVDFEEIPAEGAAQRAEMIQRSNGGRTYPQVFVRGKHVGGSDDLMALERSGELDRMLA